MIKVGIDCISFYTPKAYLDLEILATARGCDPERFKSAVGQDKMAVPSVDEDIVTMAAEAVHEVLKGVDLNSIDTLFFATESGIDQSKSAGMFVHQLLNLPHTVRVIELKQACYSATAALKLAMPFLQQNPDKKMVLVASDIARYGLGSSAESSQGAGAVAMLLSAHPRILALEPESGVYSISAMDFWRPNYCDEAFVDGMASSKLYLNCLDHAWRTYQKNSGRMYEDHDYFCFHVPVAKLVEKGFKHLLRLDKKADLFNEALLEKQVGLTLNYNRIMGNCYTAAMYLALTSLLDHAPEDLAGKRIGFYSYGSGSVSEFLSGVMSAGYQNALKTKEHQHLINDRVSLTLADYEAFYRYAKSMEGQDYETPIGYARHWRFAGVQGHKRIYGAC